MIEEAPYSAMIEVCDTKLSIWFSIKVGSNELNEQLQLDRIPKAQNYNV